MDMLTDAWAIIPAKYVEVCEVYNTHLRGEKIDLAAIEARIGRPLGNQKAYQVLNQKAIIPIEGVISKRVSLLHDISGGTSTEALQQQVLAAVEDPAVAEIILDIDSPGGAIDGVKTVADAIYAARGKKPITAWVDGTAASAAYWIASAADKILLKDLTSVVGSIGVVTAHRDYSEAEKKAGVKTTEITAGKYKRIDTQYAPLSEAGLAYIQSRVDAFYTIFVDDVARNRGVSPDVVLTDMADGRIFVGADAITAGLVDGVATWDAVIGSAPAPSPKRGVAALSETAADSSTPTEDPMEGFTQEQMDAAIAEATTTAVSDAIALEQARVQGILALAMPGYEALCMEMAADGKTSIEDAKTRILEAEQKTRSTATADLEAGSPAPLKAGSDASDVDPMEAALKERWEGSPAVRALYDGDFDAFTKAEKLRAEKTASGTVRVFTRAKSR